MSLLTPLKKALPEITMTRDFAPDLRHVRLYLTQPHSCSYLPENQATTAFVDPGLPINKKLYTELTQLGFRRSGKYFYSPRCQSCKACVSTRVPVALFEPNRKQRRCLKRNNDISVSVTRHFEIDEHYPLYQAYINQRHRDGDMYPPSLEQFKDFLGEAYDTTRYMEFRLEGRLLACCVLDELSDGLSAIYTYYTPEEEKRSLGTLAVLKAIDFAKKLQLPQVYLGFWIDQSPKMAYKRQFQPMELLINGLWQPMVDKAFRLQGRQE